MANQKIKVGDIVVLKSGGPNMTVVDKVEGAFRCMWFYEGKIKEEGFNTVALSFPKPRSAARPGTARPTTGLGS